MAFVRGFGKYMYTAVNILHHIQTVTHFTFDSFDTFYTLSKKIPL